MTVTGQKTKKVLDRQTFEKLLEATYTLQEHNQKLRAVEASLELHSEELRERDAAQEAAGEKSKSKPEERSRSNTDYTLTLAEIVEAQHQIQIQRLDLDPAMGVVAERIARITHASGAGIAILDGTTVRYRAGAGSSALPAGTEVPLTSAICQPTIRTGQVIRTRNVDTEFLFDPELARRRGIRSLLAVPIHFDGDIVGGLELYFDRVEGFADQDVHTCQLMAGLVTEAMGREAGTTLKKSMDEERSTMLAAIEKLQPNLAVLAQAPSQPVSEDAAVQDAVLTSQNIPATSPCWKCGNSLLPEEQFCGGCGASRGEVNKAGAQEDLAADEASPDPDWLLPPRSENQSDLTNRKSQDGRSADLKDEISLPFTQSEVDALAKALFSVQEEDVAIFAPAPIANSELTTDEATAAIGSSSIVPQKKTLQQQPEQEEPAEATQEAKTEEAKTENAEKTEGRGDLVWTSAAKAQDYLQSLAPIRTPNALIRFWRSRRGDFYLAVAISLVVAVIGWGIWDSSHLPGVGVGAPARNAQRAKSTTDPDLSLFDRMLISLGLAEAPEAPEYKGNPDVQVWVDLSTAQYYCPGSDLYEKTPKGKLATQREAQLDQFEPAYRKACD
jgi:putative methionine-R-sulfoxide reductase with GAF domain